MDCIVWLNEAAKFIRGEIPEDVAGTAQVVIPVELDDLAEKLTDLHDEVIALRDPKLAPGDRINATQRFQAAILALFPVSSLSTEGRS